MLTYENVIAKFSSRNKQLTVDKYDIIDWVAECVQAIGNLDYCDEFKDVPLEVKNKMGALPCNFYKLDYVYKGGNVFDLNTGSFKQPNDFWITFDQDYTNITIDYYGLPLDKEGYVAVPNELSAEACYWYCLHLLLLEDYLTGVIPENRWAFIINQKDTSMSEAEGSLRGLNKNRQNRLMQIAMNIKPKFKVPRL